jgi:hypothetical protein
MNVVIWKYLLKPGLNRIEMPRHAEVLSVGVAYDGPCLWAIVYPKLEETDSRYFYVLGTGHEAPADLLNGKFIGTFTQNVPKENPYSGLVAPVLVYHVFELPPAITERFA